MPSLFYAGQPDYIEKLNTLATAASMTNGTVAASFLSLAVTGTATAASFVGPLTGNASTATTLATARNINGVAFNGSADITVTAAAGTLTGATLAAGVTASSLTSVGTLTALTVSGQASFAAGTAAAPSVKVGAEQNGLYSSAANTLDVTLGGVRQFQFARTASAVNYPQFTGSATGGYIGFAAAGSDTNIGIVYTAKGTGTHDYYARNGINFRIGANADGAVNYFTVTGGVTGLGPVLLAGGPDTNVTARYRTQGTGSHQFETGGGEQVRVSHTAAAVNYWAISGAATGGLNTLTTQGSDTNIGAYLATKGSGAWRFATGGGDQFRIQNVASAVNYLSVYGSPAAGTGPTLYADGSDTNINLLYSLKGGGSHLFYTGGTSAIQLLVGHVASAVNWLAVTGAATGNAVTISAQGSDTNIDFALTTKGTGVLRFGTHSALAAETVTGYITIKDSAGNTRKLAVLS